MVSAVDDSVVLPDGGERGEADDYGRSADGGESQKSAGQANRIWNDGIETFTTPSSVGVQVQGRHLAANGRFLRRYDGGGEVPDSTRTPSSRVAALVQRINETSNADFVRRLLGRNRKTLDNGDGTVSTHELGYVTDADGNATVFPQVQSADYGNLLMRVPYPMSYDRAAERGDTVRMSVPDAEAFTSGYKNFYPGFGDYACGGLLRRYYEGGHKPVGAAGGETQSAAPISFDWNGTLPGSLYIPQSVPDYTPVPYSANGYALERAERNEAREPAAAATATDTSRVIHLSPAQARAALKQINQRNSEIAGEDTAEGMQPAASTRVDSHIEPVLQSIDFPKAPEAYALNARVFGASERRAVAAAVGQLQSGDELKDFQRLLAELGYYKNLKTPEIKAKTKDEVKELQRMLKSYGYDIGTTGENKDGIDGIVGQRTRAAFAKYAAEHPSEEMINSVADGKLGPATRRAAAAYFRDVLTDDRIRQEIEKAGGYTKVLEDAVPQNLLRTLHDSYLDMKNLNTWKDMASATDRVNEDGIPVVNMSWDVSDDMLTRLVGFLPDGLTASSQKDWRSPTKSNGRVGYPDTFDSPDYIEGNRSLGTDLLKKCLAYSASPVRVLHSRAEARLVTLLTGLLKTV